MKNRVSTQNVLIAALLVAVVAMSIGFATIERNLKIDGTVNLTGNKFDVHFQDGSYKESTGSVQATSSTLSGLQGTYTVTLEKPGDFYEFEGKVENTGDFDASLTNIELTNSLPADQQKYITYTFTYGSNSYTAASNNITGVTLVKKTGVETFKVRVYYVMPDDEANLLKENLSDIQLGVRLHYVQA